MYGRCDQENKKREMGKAFFPLFLQTTRVKIYIGQKGTTKAIPMSKHSLGVSFLWRGLLINQSPFFLLCEKQCMIQLVFFFKKKQENCRVTYWKWKNLRPPKVGRFLFYTT